MQGSSWYAENSYQNPPTGWYLLTLHAYLVSTPYRTDFYINGTRVVDTAATAANAGLQHLVYDLRA